MSNRIYFAHQQSLYGTPAEQALINKIRQVYRRNEFDPVIINPGDEHFQTEYNRHLNINFFLGVCATCESCVCTTFRDGSFGAGVGKEVESFLLRGCVVRMYDWNRGYFTILDTIEYSKVLSIEETREQLHRDKQAYTYTVKE